MPVLAALWAFLNSPLGTALALAVVGKALHSSVKSRDRREQILGIASRVFDAVEVLGVSQGLGANAKWVEFVRRIVDQLKAEGLGELSGPEMAMLKALAEQKALIKKAPK